MAAPVARNCRCGTASMSKCRNCAGAGNSLTSTSPLGGDEQSRSQQADNVEARAKDGVGG